MFNSPPPTQGLASLMLLALFERLGVRQAESFDHVHGLIEATKRALQVRDGVITDPDRLAHSVDRYLTSRFLDAQAGEIDRRKAAPWPAKETWRPKTVTQKLLLAGSSSSRAGAGDTVWMGSADASGLVVSYIQSLYWEFGSGVVLPATGVLMQNRGASFSLDQQRVERARAGPVAISHAQPRDRRARMTAAIIAYGAMGGDGQPQTQAAIFTRHVVIR